MRQGALTLAAALALAHAGQADAANPQVAAIQVALAAQRFYPGLVDGVAGAATVSAVRSFQRAHGLPLTGHAGPATRRALGRLGRPRFGTRVMRRGAVGLDVATLQFLLATRGFDVGTLDGAFGPRTRDAVVAYQRRAGLLPDGVAGPATLAKLRAASRRGPFRFHAAWPDDPVTEGTVRTEVEQRAARAHVAPSLARAVAWVESGYQANVRSSTGDWGPMQVSAPAWDYVETVLVKRAVPHTTRGNIRVGILYLHHLLHEFDGNERLAVGAYHQGAASVRERGLIAETEAYVGAILNLQDSAHG